MKFFPFNDHYQRIYFGPETGIEIGQNVNIAYNKITDPRSNIVLEEVSIGNNTKIRDGAIIYSGCWIGKETMIGHNVIVREVTTIGTHCKIGHGTVLEGAITIGDHTSIQPLCLIAAYSEIGSYVFVGPGTITTNDWAMDYKRPNIQSDYHGVTILDGARIGAGCTIIPGATIGREAKIGAGSLVTKDIPDFKRAIGNPVIIGKDIPENELLKNNDIDI